MKLLLVLACLMAVALCQDSTFEEQPRFLADNATAPADTTTPTTKNDTTPADSSTKTDNTTTPDTKPTDNSTTPATNDTKPVTPDTNTTKNDTTPVPPTKNDTTPVQPIDKNNSTSGNGTSTDKANQEKR